MPAGFPKNAVNLFIFHPVPVFAHDVRHGAGTCLAVSWIVGWLVVRPSAPLT